MADVTLNITIPNAHVQRVKDALGFTTKAQAEAWVRNIIKKEVISFEQGVVYQAEIEKVRQAEADMETAIEAARQDSETVELT